MTDKLKRYELRKGYDVYYEDHYAFHAEAPNGEWVRYQDVLDRIEQLETSARYHAIEVGCECLDCYQIREAEQYANGGTENE